MPRLLVLSDSSRRRVAASRGCRLRRPHERRSGAFARQALLEEPHEGPYALGQVLAARIDREDPAGLGSPVIRHGLQTALGERDAHHHARHQPHADATDHRANQRQAVVGAKAAPHLDGLHTGRALEPPA